MGDIDHKHISLPHGDGDAINNDKKMSVLSPDDANKARIQVEFMKNINIHTERVKVFNTLAAKHTLEHMTEIQNQAESTNPTIHSVLESIAASLKP
jgi:hypothetical protein